nr:reverse transcriptase domain-containing protein [Tanacetum cinerariifolium]
MSTRSSARNLFPPLDNPELTIRRRSRTDPTLLNNSKMAAEGNGDLPVPDLWNMKELCQPSLNGRGGPIVSIAIQATNFGLKNNMIQQVQNSCQFHGLPASTNPLPNCPPLDVSLGDERGPELPIKPHSPDSFRMKVVDNLTIHTPPSPHMASFLYKCVYCYYHPCIDDPKKHYGFNPVILGQSGSIGVDFLNLEVNGSVDSQVFVIKFDEFLDCVNGVEIELVYEFKGCVKVGGNGLEMVVDKLLWKYEKHNESLVENRKEYDGEQDGRKENDEFVLCDLSVGSIRKDVNLVGKCHELRCVEDRESKNKNGHDVFAFDLVSACDSSVGDFPWINDTGKMTAAIENEM